MDDQCDRLAVALEKCHRPPGSCVGRMKELAARIHESVSTFDLERELQRRVIEHFSDKVSKMGGIFASAESAQDRLQSDAGEDRRLHDCQKKAEREKCSPCRQEPPDHVDR